jgi:protein TonB
MKTVVTMGPAGTAGLDELSVRGRLRARLLVRADGSVGSVDIIVSSGDHALDDAARRGLLRWRFIPARRNNEPIDAYVALWVTFSE